MRQVFMGAAIVLATIGCMSRKPARTTADPRFTSTDSIREELAHSLAKLQAKLDSASKASSKPQTPEFLYLRDSSVYREVRGLLDRIDSLQSAAMGNPGKYYYLRIR
jgi:hypothetical protein